MYKGLPIITNKIPVDERSGVPHHLIDLIGLEEKPWTVTQFVKESCSIIEQIRARGKLPIVVGGTHYYTHALLFKDATLSEDNQADNSIDADQEIDKKWPILSRSTEEIYQELQRVDPEIAKRWHPADRRKIQRSLHIWLKTGRKASEVYAEQQRHRMTGGKVEGELVGPEPADLEAEGLRFPTLVLWLEAQDSALKQRLNSRVDLMVRNGLADEAQTLARLEDDLVRQGVQIDHSKGIWVSIGYKEMEPYFRTVTTGADVKKSVAALQQAIESIKAGTRRYAKRQNRYIRIRLSNALGDADRLDRLFLLDCTDLDHWDQHVAHPADGIVDSFLKGEHLPDPKSLSELAKSMLSGPRDGKHVLERVAKPCEICDKVLMTEKEWNIHLSSRSHKKAAAAHRKRSVTLGDADPYQTESSATKAG